MPVRTANCSDAEAISAIYAPYVLKTAISFEETAPSAAEMAARLTATLPDYPFLAYEEAGEVIGYAYAGAHNHRPAYRWSANVSVYVEHSVHRRGVGRALRDA